MAVKKRLFRGVKVQWDKTGASTFADIGEVRSVTPPSRTRESVDVTVAASPDGFREKLRKSFRDGGQFMFTVMFDDTSYKEMADQFDLDVDVPPKWKFSVPTVTGETTAPSWTFDGWILELSQPERNTDDGDAFMVDITVEITGKVTFAEGTP